MKGLHWVEWGLKKLLVGFCPFISSQDRGLALLHHSRHQHYDLYWAGYLLIKTCTRLFFSQAPSLISSDWNFLQQGLFFSCFLWCRLFSGDSLSVFSLPSLSIGGTGRTKRLNAAVCASRLTSCFTAAAFSACVKRKKEWTSAVHPTTALSW